MQKVYNPKEVEDRLYKMWLDKKYFHAKIDYSKKPFTIVIPPPNITGQLHMGHALNNTIQDILIRFKRMQGYCALWLPGTDHASIATEAKIVEKMKEEGLTKEMIGREKFLERAWEWKRVYGGRIIEQLKKLGASCDWDRERFTMDEGLSNAVKEVFVRLYEKGLIYKGERMINWCPTCHTTISDAEVEYEEKKGKLYYIKYPAKDNSYYVIVATTRPETMLGDTAVAVNPNDQRYKHLIGKTVVLPLVNREIPIIADDYVDMEFGTGVVKITPAHDPNDFEIGQKHNLPMVQVIDTKGYMNENAGKYAGQERYEARKNIVKDLKDLGLLVKEEDYTHNVGHCYRCSTVIEPLVSKQWFVKMKPLAEPAIKVVKEGKIKFIPERFEKIYFNWMENIKDWCISRQLWWGHRIPAYYCRDCENMMVSREEVKVCSKCGSTNVYQDEDTLDTWFSSALWPFSTLGWPEETEDLKYFYPTDVLVTAYDIIFFWVARMIFSGLEHMGKEPFKYVLIHGIVRDAQGRKMSKSLGNGIDPLEVIEKYGADALRFTLVTGISPGNDTRFHMEKVEANRNFANKIWNAARFVIMNLDIDTSFKPDESKFTFTERWILSRLDTLISEVTENLEKFEIGIAAQKLYDFIWDEFCDWYIEMSKPILYNKEAENNKEVQYVLLTVLTNVLKLLHPFMPFVTEEIYLNLPHVEESLVIATWPKPRGYQFTEDIQMVEKLIELIRSLRNLRLEKNIKPDIKPKVYIKTDDLSMANQLSLWEIYLKRLANFDQVIISNEAPEDSVALVLSWGVAYVKLKEIVDVQAELKRLLDEKERLLKEVERSEKLLNNQNFLQKAPEKVVNEEKEKYERYKQMLLSVVQQIERLESLR
ncbi:valyl-tRNA synthetase [Caldicellulosiruptor bescii]|uniref:Valine--tRNA ligase n=2 Tax=Caldicellulosiruptor bescii TaxID=31899 RepID=B9MJT1_CALBD|nr:valine--tRNA ligase [Caldicellulosiruptor bescii]ACM60589.1 valyl-tRNA synthetase [Caldicellulosiruptor bescii DSM 6725]PBC88000.1 valyl-tRNA synthetase [Caldicellulosiruptor bescii]PBC90932.1 valyl-tRNA synthetase [Caldicellulosiruptor bescii]PBD03636.1 valyl-tRNA synthetase [Caldicellulosiruptor bescii]PBD06730.1 valyl-tRNA synthetase [Caldicellulosiruptor bescii]